MSGETAQPVRVGVVGLGYWGPNIARNFAAIGGCELRWLCDSDAVARLELPQPRVDGDALVAHALAFDRFGNVMLDATHADLEGSGIRLGRPLELESDAGEGRRAG